MTCLISRVLGGAGMKSHTFMLGTFFEYTLGLYKPRFREDFWKKNSKTFHCGNALLIRCLNFLGRLYLLMQNFERFWSHWKSITQTTHFRQANIRLGREAVGAEITNTHIRIKIFNVSFVIIMERRFYALTKNYNDLFWK